MGQQRPDGIIILGVPRSGTTLLRRLLNGHPEIHCGGETFLLTAAARFLRSDRIADGINYGVLGGLAAAGIPREQVIDGLRGLVESYFRRLAGQAGKPRWASKTAIDSFYAAEIEQLFAGRAHFICIVRHGLDTALSLKDLCDVNEIYIREIHEYVIRDARPLAAFARLWSDITTEILDLAGRHTESSIVLRYEDLVARPEPSLERLAAFVGLKRGSLRLDTLRQDSPSGLGDWKTYGKTAVDASSINRWRELGAGSLNLLAPIVNPVLTRAGYEAIVAGKAPTADQAMRRYEITMGMQAKRRRAEDQEHD